jgi:hypothetical protein
MGIADTARTGPSPIPVDYLRNGDDRLPLGRDGFAIDRLHVSLRENFP